MKSKKEALGNPGEIRGTVDNDDLGKITNNSNFGIFGELSETERLNYEAIEKVTVGLRTDIELGEAKIINNFSGERKEYNIMIDKIYLNDTEDNKSFAIRIVDEKLIQDTGGIIRGLSR
ncbi:MAG: hypothetical protein IJ629_00205 [Clostridia bacterium]|nr:hypothetical protein [Clostridia bacterium]